MTLIVIDCDEIKDWSSFHEVFKRKFGFPEFYGQNMNAWIDCMGYLDEEKEDMTSIKIKKGSTLSLQLNNVTALVSESADIYNELIECTAFVNFRRTSIGEPALIALSFYK